MPIDKIVETVYDLLASIVNEKKLGYSYNADIYTEAALDFPFQTIKYLMEDSIMSTGKKSIIIFIVEENVGMITQIENTKISIPSDQLLKAYLIMLSVIRTFY